MKNNIGICGFCYKEDVELFDAKCKEDPLLKNNLLDNIIALNAV